VMDFWLRLPPRMPPRSASWAWSLLVVVVLAVVVAVNFFYWATQRG